MSRKEPSKLVARLQDGAVATDVGLRGERIVGLAARQGARDAIHGKGRGFLILQLLNQILVLFGPQEGNQRAIFQGLDFVGRRRTELFAVL